MLPGPRPKYSRRRLAARSRGAETGSQAGPPAAPGCASRPGLPFSLALLLGWVGYDVYPLATPLPIPRVVQRAVQRVVPAIDVTRRPPLPLPVCPLLGLLCFGCAAVPVAVALAAPASLRVSEFRQLPLGVLGAQRWQLAAGLLSFLPSCGELVASASPTAYPNCRPPIHTVHLM